ncbi:SDR family NAD(P)-dependent oxidoreductase [Salinibacterium soli]|uniref:SDR family NAD(P)-dependent oxidoreductase n=1 Tax=Antiquaquibacter soli TaxID=3064523 RepID=A0ABT9BQE2_9MICO|nr:SDR family NAD(P)-dependent oxidoreductase [Protaetiibacter sp. WY-16]MDO7883251.1 SDR family NAD(P)-dependent oxidoreductase [Protaetiibacter sp. WY-16]
MADTTSTALVTGAASGIGRAVAARLAADGARVVCADANAVGLDETISAIERAGGSAAAVVLDVTDRDAVARLVGSADLDGLDRVALCAGIYRATPVDAFSIDDYRRVLEVNLTSSVALLVALVPRLRAAEAPRAVTVSSIHSQFAEAGSSAYAVSKAGLVAATKALAVELAGDGILVNSIAPGFIDTPMAVLEDGTNEHDTAGFRSVYVEHGKLPLGRPGTPEEVAAAASFLLSPDNGYITGHVLVVDGGLTATF